MKKNNKKQLNISKETLSKNILFNGLHPDNIEEIFNCLTPVIIKYQKNEVILHEGSYTDSIGIIIKGSISIERNDYWGNKQIINRFADNDIFGETFACLDSTPLNVTVTSVTDSIIMFLNISSILQTCSPACSHHSRLIINLLNTIAIKNLTLSKKLDIITQKNTREKILAFLSEEAKKNNSDKFTIDFNREQMAQYLSVDRSAMSTEISKLVKEGIIYTEGKYFEILNKQSSDTE